MTSDVLAGEIGSHGVLVHLNVELKVLQLQVECDIDVGIQSPMEKNAMLEHATATLPANLATTKKLKYAMLKFAQD